MPVGAIVGAGALGAGASIFGATKAANAQKSAAQMAIASQEKMFGIAQEGVQPFINAGKDAWSILAPMLGMGDNPRQTDIYGNPVQQGFGALTNPFQPTQEMLESMPGYQFQLQQGLKNTQNSAAAKGLASSGNALKGAADYTQGLASSNWQQAFTDYNAQNQQIYNMLYGPTQQGAQSASSLGGQAIQTGQNIGNAQIGAGNANAAMWNSIGSSVSNAANMTGGAIYGNTMFNQMMAQNGGQGYGPSSMYSGGGGQSGQSPWGTPPSSAGALNPLYGASMPYYGSTF